MIFYILLGIEVAAGIWAVSFLMKSIRLARSGQPMQNQKNTNKNVKNPVQQTGRVQDILGFEKIDNDMIKLNKNEYCMAIMCDGIQFMLGTAQEQSSNEIMISGFYETCSGAEYQTVVQNHKVNLKKVFKRMDRDLVNIASNERQVDYGRTIIDHYQRQTADKDVLTKRKYIVIKYKSQNGIFSEKDVEKNAKEVLENKVASICSELGNMGINYVILNNDGLAEMLYATYNRDKDLHMNFIDMMNYGHSSLYISGLKGDTYVENTV